MHAWSDGERALQRMRGRRRMKKTLRIIAMLPRIAVVFILGAVAIFMDWLWID